MDKINITTNRAQIGDEKNWVICLVIMFTSKVMVIKLSKMADFLYFLLMTVKKITILASVNERSSWVISKSDVLLDCCLWDIEGWNKETAFSRVDDLLVTIRVQQSIAFSERTK